MEASELRIGNWVESIPHNKHTTILRLDIDYDVSCKPIPLTEDWLTKVGFIWSIYHQAIHKEGFDFDLNEASYGGYFLSTWKRGVHIAEEIKYVHQLQNLYFALTGNELTTK